MIKLNGLEVKFEKFPNGETRMLHENLIIKDYSHVDFKYEDDSDLIKLHLVSEYLYTRTIGATLRIQYMPYSRMDRSENDSPFTLKYIATLINNLDFDQVEIIEPHSDVTVELIRNSKANYINFDLIENVKKMVAFNEDKDYIVFPDAGANKRYREMKAQNTLYCNKIRDSKTGEIESLELVGDTSNTYGKAAIIVDDLSSYGGTFIHTANRLREEGFVEVNLLVAHAENSIFKGKLFEHIDKVFTTDSILTKHSDWHNKKYEAQLHVYKIEELLSND